VLYVEKWASLNFIVAGIFGRMSTVAILFVEGWFWIRKGRSQSYLVASIRY